MARRGGRRGRRSRSKQRSRGAGSRSSKAKSNKSRSRNTRGSGARKSSPSKRRNTRRTTTSRASNRRSTASKRRQQTRRAAPKRTAPKKKAPTRRTTKNKRGSGISSKRKNIGTKIGTSVKKTVKKVTSSVKNTAKKAASKVKKTVGRITRPPAASARTKAFNKQLSDIQKRFPGASPNSAIFGMSEAQLSQPGGPFAQPGAGPANDPDYKTAYAPNVGLTNKLRTNPITNLARDAAYGLGFNTPRLMAQSAEAQQGIRDQRSQFHVGNKPRPTRPRKMGGSKRPLAVHADIRTPPPEEIIEETQPITGDMSGTDSSNLTRIQNQAYATTLANNMAGLTGDFDFGPQSSQMSISEAPGLQAGQSRGRRRIRRFNRGRRRGAGDSFRRGGRRIQEFTSTQLNI